MDSDFQAEPPLPLLATKRLANSRGHVRRAAFENGGHRGGGLRMLVEFGEGRVGGAEEGAGVEGSGVEAVVVDADPAIGVTEGEIGGEIEEEGAGRGGEGEFGEGGGIDADADATRTEYDPEIENKEAGEEKEAAESAAAYPAAVPGGVRHIARVREMDDFTVCNKYI